MEGKDPESGHVYFYNQLTGKSQWDRPTVEALLPPPSAPVLPNLPPGWEETTDPGSGMWIMQIKLQFLYMASYVHYTPQMVHNGKQGKSEQLWKP